MTRTAMDIDYVSLLTRLQKSLTQAIAQQEYHRLLELDKAVRQCVSEAVARGQNDRELAAQVAQKIKELLPVYQLVAQVCSEKSAAIKKELCQVKQTRKGASQYLSIAGKFA